MDLTPKQIAEFEEVFRAYDLSGEGLVDHRELGVMLRALGLPATEADTLDAIAQVDSDGSGRLDFTEFLNMMCSRLRDTDVVQEEDDAFRDMDKDGDGVVSLADLRATADALGEDLTDVQLRDMLKEVDLSRVGALTREDFSKLLAST